MDTADTSETLTKEQLWNRDAAISRLGGNEGLLNRIVEMFLGQIEQKQHALREKASSIENKAKQNDLTEIDQDVNELDNIIKQTVAVMQS
jgi:hypothetical protein